MASRKQDSSGRFVVDLGALKLSAVDQRAVAAAIQGAVLSYLGSRRLVSGGEAKLLGDGEGTAGMIVGG